MSVSMPVNFQSLTSRQSFDFSYLHFYLSQGDVETIAPILRIYLNVAFDWDDE